MITLVSYRAARAGIITGVLLAVARIAGETAPLLFTALNNQFWSTDLNEPMANLPVVIFQFAMSPYDDWHRARLGRRAADHAGRAGASTSSRAPCSPQKVAMIDLTPIVTPHTMATRRRLPTDRKLTRSGT